MHHRSDIAVGYFANRGLHIEWRTRTLYTGFQCIGFKCNQYNFTNTVVSHTLVSLCNVYR